MKLLGLFGVVFVGCAQALSTLDSLEWEAWKSHHGKNYSSISEEKFRMNVYMENKRYIESHNTRYHKGEHTFTMKMNHFGDLLEQEFRTMNGFNLAMGRKTKLETPASATFVSPENANIPESIDWRELGAVTEAKDQRGCGSCWAFSTTGALEGQHFRKTGILTSLSEQQLIDCSTKDNGCGGGTMESAFTYVKAQGGIDTEESYPYHGAADNDCLYNPKNKGAWDVGYVEIPVGNEQKLMEAVATVGPCSVAVNADPKSFTFYHSGVYSDPSCSSVNLDHGVLVVGYGKENGQEYWIIKNSWSAKWGEQGFMKLAKDKGNMCGVAIWASYPLL